MAKPVGKARPAVAKKPKLAPVEEKRCFDDDVSLATSKSPYALKAMPLGACKPAAKLPVKLPFAAKRCTVLALLSEA